MVGEKMITSTRITKVEAERKSNEAITGVRFNINIQNVKTSGEEVEVEYAFEVTYQGKKEDVGHLTITGNLQAKEEKKVVANIEKEWKEKKRLPIEFAETVINTINFVCGANGTLVSLPVGLTPPIPMPQAKLQTQEGTQAS